MLLALAAACTSSSTTETRAAEPGAAADVRFLVNEILRVHPAPFHVISRDEFMRAADSLEERAPGLARDRLLVELMHLTALLGERDGHSGVFPLDAHDRPLHLYPLRLYRFPEGVFVVGAIGVPGVIGSRLVAVEGRPLTELETEIRALVPRDNEHSRSARSLQYLVTAEVLHGLGVTDGPDGATFTVESRGSQRDVALRPVTAQRFASVFHDDARLAIEPDLRVELTAADFFGGRDPVLSAGVSLRAP